MASVVSFNDGETFACLTEFDRPNGCGDGERVTLARAAVDAPYRCSNDSAYRLVFSYFKRLGRHDLFESKAVSPVFDRALAEAEVLPNDQQWVATHSDDCSPVELDVRRADGLRKPEARAGRADQARRRGER